MLPTRCSRGKGISANFHAVVAISDSKPGEYRAAASVDRPPGSLERNARIRVSSSAWPVPDWRRTSPVPGYGSVCGQ